MEEISCHTLPTQKSGPQLKHHNTTSQCSCEAYWRWLVLTLEELERRAGEYTSGERYDDEDH
jgi:hypothetical protein